MCLFIIKRLGPRHDSILYATQRMDTVPVDVNPFLYVAPGWRLGQTEMCILCDTVSSKYFTCDDVGQETVGQSPVIHPPDKDWEQYVDGLWVSLGGLIYYKRWTCGSGGQSCNVICNADIIMMERVCTYLVVFLSSSLHLHKEMKDLLGKRCRLYNPYYIVSNEGKWEMVIREMSME